MRQNSTLNQGKSSLYDDVKGEGHIPKIAGFVIWKLLYDANGASHVLVRCCQGTDREQQIT